MLPTQQVHFPILLAIPIHGWGLAEETPDSVPFVKIFCLAGCFKCCMGLNLAVSVFGLLAEMPIRTLGNKHIWPNVSIQFDLLKAGPSSVKM